MVSLKETNLIQAAEKHDSTTTIICSLECTLLKTLDIYPIIILLSIRRFRFSTLSTCAITEAPSNTHGRQPASSRKKPFPEKTIAIDGSGTEMLTA